VALYEKQRVHHVGVIEALEDQLTSWVPGKPSPDRLDALVHGITALSVSIQPATISSPSQFMERYGRTA
jgi:phage terminase large subunit-like protein